MVLDRATARALADAGLMHPAEYVRLCRLYGWGTPRRRPALRVVAISACMVLAVALLCPPALAASPHHRSRAACVPVFEEGVGTILICAPAARRR